MKWIPIAKAKVKFETLYLIKGAQKPVTGYLYKSETTSVGIKHAFLTMEAGVEVPDVTHIAIITDPQAENAKKIAGGGGGN